MLATLHIKRLVIDTIIGVYEEEQNTTQSLQFDIEITYEPQKALLSDHIEDAIDYDAICQNITNKVKQSRFYLLESLGNFVITIVMQHQDILRATVRITKPHCIANADSVELTMAAKREQS